MTRLLVLAVLVGACSSSTGPQGLDPTVLVSNHGTPADTVFFTWHDGQGITGADTILPGATRCEKFLARPDSAYFEAHDRGVASAWSNWFNPSTRPAWTLIYNNNGAGTSNMLLADVSPNEPC